MQSFSINTPLGSLTVSHNGAAITRAYLGAEQLRDELSSPRSAIQERITGAVCEYFSGLNTSLLCGLPVALLGTPFQVAVWTALRNVPFGETRSYADIASTIGHPRALQAVGTACGRNPCLLFTPCHRIIKKNGDIGGFSGGEGVKERLLRFESEQLARPLEAAISR